MKPVNPRSVTDEERPWIDNWSPNAHRLLLAEVATRHTRRLALNLCSYCSTRSIGEDPGVAPGVKAGYRKILAELAADGIAPPPLKGRHGLTVTPQSYNGERGLQPVPAATAPSPAARRAASAASAPMPAAKKRLGDSPDDIEKRLVSAEGLPYGPPRMYDALDYVECEREFELAMAA